MTTRPITYRFHLPRNVAADVRRRLESPRLRERLRYREALGYLPGDRDAITDAPPATILTALEVDASGAAVATLEPLGTDEGRIVRALAARLEPGDYRFTLARDSYGNVEGLDFALSDTARRVDVIRALKGRAGGFSDDDASEIAALLCPPDKDFAPTPPPPAPKRQPMPDALVTRVRAQEAAQAAREARSRPLGFDFD